MLISFEGETIIVGNIDDTAEHYILLKSTGFSENGIDKISKALKIMNFDVQIDIPTRYRRHCSEIQN